MAKERVIWKENLRSEKEVVNLIMELKLKDERRHLHELKQERKEKRRILEELVTVKTSFKKHISQINGESRKWRKIEKERYKKKADHIRKLRIEEEEKLMEKCPIEINEYKDLRIFNKLEMERIKKDKTRKKTRKKARKKYGKKEGRK